MAVLDTNVLLRYLTDDNPAQAERALALLERVESGERSVALAEAVLVETVQVLSSKRLYDVPREVIQRRLADIIRMPGIRIPNKRTYIHALDLYVAYTRLSFVDALLVAHTQREPDTTLISFAQDFRRQPGITWEQP